MHLITMAHLGEAQGVISTFKLERMTPELFKNEELILLLTGEGPFEAATKTALTIPQYPITSVINLGIAGGLKETQVGDIYPIRTLYLLQDFKPVFKTFQSLDEGLDCLTSFERILDPHKAQLLKGLGHLVDREAWGVAMAAKTAALPFKAYKIISDVAGTLNACELIKEEAPLYSDRLADFLKTLLGTKTPAVLEEKLSLPGFHFTFTSEHLFNNLLSKLSIKEERTSEEILASLPLAELKKQKLAPKERTRRLLDIMDKRIDPFKELLQNEKSKLQKKFNDRDLKIEIDPQWENPKVTISFEAGSDEELKSKLQELEQLSINSFTKLMNGEIHVE